MKLSIKILLYYYYFKAFQNYVIKNNAALGVSDDLAKALGSKWTDVFSTAFDPYTDPLTNGPITASDMNGALNDCAPFVEGVRLGIKNNPLVKLSATDRAYLLIPIEKARKSKIPVTKAKPNVTSTGKSSMSIGLFVYDPEFPDKTTKPYGAGSYGWKIAIMPVGVVPVDTDYATQIPEKNSKFQRLLTLPDVGKQFWMIAYYLSPTNEKGEDGEAFNTLII